MTRMTLSLFALMLCGVMSFGARAADAKPEPTLKPGDPAPALYLAKFVKGEPVKELEKGKVYVMEFWATWCGPCIAAMPHVTEMQKTYDKDVIVLGVNIWEKDLSLVEPFVEKQGERMGYRVAMEQVIEGQPRGKMATEWMAAAGRNGIPCSFIIDKTGVIAWIGHPMSLDGPLAKVVAGTFDIKAQAELEKAVDGLREQLSTAARAKDYDKALGVLDQMAALDPAIGTSMQGTRLTFLYQKGDYTAGNLLAAQIAASDVAKDESRAVSLAYTMLIAPDPEKIDADLALKLAQQAAGKLKDDPNGTGDMLLAKAYAAKKDYTKAVEYQQKLVDRATAPTVKAAAEKQLAVYKEKAAAK